MIQKRLQKYTDAKHQIEFTKRSQLCDYQDQKKKRSQFEEFYAKENKIVESNNMDLTKLKLYDNGEVRGYDQKELKEAMPEALWERFCDWYTGSTGAIIDGKFIVYQWDLETFLAGLPNFD